MIYYKQIIVLFLLVQVLALCWAQIRYEPNSWSAASNDWADMEEFGTNNDNTNTNLNKESDLVDKFLSMVYKSKNGLYRNARFANQYRRKKFLTDSANLQGLWAMPGRR